MAESLPPSHAAPVAAAQKSGGSIRLGLVGVGKIARDQHLPSVARTDRIDLVAVASRNATLDDIASFDSLDAMLANGPEIDAVALCTPPQSRALLAERALRAGKHVLLEKPPGATLSEVEVLRDLATSMGLTLFATWHSRFAPAVAPARTWLADKRIDKMSISWKEDVRHWHPGQDWIWQPGGLGVFDPGINALSIATEILPGPVFLHEAVLEFPENRAAPIAAQLVFEGFDGTRVEAIFDWRQTGPQSWDISVETDGGRLDLAEGGAKMSLDGELVSQEPEAEYAGIYRRFVELVASGASDVDVAPLRHVADAFMLGERQIVTPFFD